MPARAIAGLEVLSRCILPEALMPCDSVIIILYWSKEDQAFIAEVPELAACAADGAMHQEAIVNAEVVIREWIETALELGRPVSEPRGRLIYA
jgi:predicted RNase H-like HicB family nuclease